MSDKRETTDDQLTSEAVDEHWFQVGKAAGLEEAAKRLMEAAVSRFEAGDDKEAKLLRVHGKHLRARATEEHPRWNKKT